MEHFRNAKVVRLLSHHNKYLTGDDDDEDGVCQQRNGASREAKWEVEVVEARTDVIRLKSCRFNRYLATSDKRFLLGALGRKVVLLPLPPKQTPESLGSCVEWQPIRDGERRVKLRTKDGTFLRANGIVKPYGNTVSHGNPQRTVTQDWVLWEVDVIDMVYNPTKGPSPAVADVAVVQPSISFNSYPASAVAPAAKVLVAAATKARSRTPTNSDVSVGSSGVSVDDDNKCGDTPSPRSTLADSPARRTSLSASSDNIDTVPIEPATRSSLRSSSSVCSSLPPSPCPSRPVRIRTPPSPPRSCSTVSSSLPPSSPQHRPVRNSTPPSPPSSRSTVSSSPPRPARPPPVRIPTTSASPGRSSSTASSSSPRSPGGPPPPSRIHRSPPSGVSPASSRRKLSIAGRRVHYYFADDDGEVDDNFESGSFDFHGSTAKELIDQVEKATGVDNFILCTRSVIDDRLHRLSLIIPVTPNRSPMTVFIVHPNSKVAKSFS